MLVSTQFPSADFFFKMGSVIFFPAQRGQQWSRLIRNSDGDIHQSWPHCGHVCGRFGEAGPRPGNSQKLILYFLQNMKNIILNQNGRSISCPVSVMYKKKSVKFIIKSILRHSSKDKHRHNMVITEKPSEQPYDKLLSIFVFIFIVLFVSSGHITITM